MPKFNVYFLGANTPLSKQFWVDSDGTLQKSSYPNVKNFTSHREPVENLREFHKALVAHAAEGHCLIKGTLHKDLDNESRAGSTKSDDSTQWLCLDLDDAPFKTPKEFMASIPDLKDVAHVVQYSASAGIGPARSTLSCHIFVMLDAKIAAGHIKTWLMHTNLSNDELRKGITLSPTGAALHWPLDVTTCQNDKLLYIAPPTLGKGVKSSLKEAERIQYVAGTHPTLSAKKLQPKRTLEQVREESRELLNELRKAQDLKPLRSSTKWVGEFEVQPKPGQATITGMRADRGFVYFNLNGGNSWGYYHPEGNPELIHNFKGEPSYFTKELLPDYYKEQRIQQKEQQASPTEGGELVLAFRDKRTALYMNGTWNETTQELELHPAKSELQLNHWMQNHGLPPFEVIPVWDVHFDPQSDVIVDEENKRINTYVPSKYMRLEHKPGSKLEAAPLIKRIIMHAVSGGQEDETFEHFLNWLAVIFQQRVKPLTAWILHGTEGTGKGVLINKILAPLLGRQYVVAKRASELEEKYNAYLEQALICFIDEIKVSASARKDIISGDLRNFITEEVVSIRAMNRVSVTVPNYTGFIFSSNENDPVVIKENDRRYNVGVFQKQRLILKQHELDVVLPNELTAFMSYIMTRPADRELAAQVLRNQAHRDLITANKTSIDVTLGQLANGDMMGLWDMRMDLNMALQLTGGTAGFAHLYNDVLKRELHVIWDAYKDDSKLQVAAKRAPESTFVVVESRISRDELLVVMEHCVGNMPKTPNKFTSLLKHRGVPTERMRINGAAIYGLRVQWRVPASWLIETMEAMEEQIPKPKLRAV